MSTKTFTLSGYGPKMTDAEFFDDAVKYRGVFPELLRSKKDVKQFNITDLVITPRFGAWKITQVNFEDGSYYNVGRPDQGPQKEEDVQQD